MGRGGGKVDEKSRVHNVKQLANSGPDFVQDKSFEQ